MNAPKKNVQRPVWNHLLLLGRCSSIVGKSRVQRSGLGAALYRPSEMGVAARSAIENRDRFIRFKAASLPSERLIAHSVRPSVRPSSNGGVEWSKSRTVSYSNRRHGAIIAPTPTTARSTDGRRLRSKRRVCAFRAQQLDCMQRLGGKNNEMLEHGLHCPYVLTLSSPT